MPLPSSLGVVHLVLPKRRFRTINCSAMRTLVFFGLVRRTHMSLQARPVAADVLALLAGEALGRRMPICNMCFKDASGPCSIRAISTLEAPRAGWVVYTLMHLQVDFRYESLSATRKRTFQDARVRSVLSGDVCLEIRLAIKGFPALLTYRPWAVFALVYASHMVEHVEPVSICAPAMWAGM